MPSTDPILMGLETVLLTVDGVDYVKRGFADNKSVYEKDGARIRILGPASITEYMGHRKEFHEIELLIVVGLSDADRNEKMQIANERMDEISDIIEAKSNASLGGAVLNTMVTAKDGGIGEYVMDSQNHVVCKMIIQTERLVEYRA